MRLNRIFLMYLFAVSTTMSVIIVIVSGCAWFSKVDHTLELPNTEDVARIVIGKEFGIDTAKHSTTNRGDIDTIISALAEARSVSYNEHELPTSSENHLYIYPVRVIPGIGELAPVLVLFTYEGNDLVWSSASFYEVSQETSDFIRSLFADMTTANCGGFE